MEIKKYLKFSMFVAGFTAMAAQIVFLREFMVVFSGNEISIGLILGFWLIWGGIGSYSAGKSRLSISKKFIIFPAVQFLLSILLPLSLAFMRSSRDLTGAVPGEVLGYFPMILIVLTVLSAPCFLMGLLYSWGCSIYKNRGGCGPRKAAVTMYLSDASGGLIGGIVTGVALIRFFSASSILFMIAAINLLSASFLFKGKKVLAKVLMVMAFFSLIVSLTPASVMYREFTLKGMWREQHLLESRDSIYGNLAVTKRGEQVSFYNNGLHLFSIPDKLSAETAVHFIMLQSPRPERVLLLGGGPALLREVLKYDDVVVDYVELDPMLIDISRKYSPPDLRSDLGSSRVNVINQDGRLFVKDSDRSYDCVVIAMGDPYTAQLNRFYTVEFFSELKKVLTEDGVVGFSLSAAENFLSREILEYLGSIQASLKQVFPSVLAVPGDEVTFIAASEPAYLSPDIDVIRERINRKGLELDYVRDYYLVDRLSPERVENLNDIIAGREMVEKNHDLKPLSYFLASIAWGAQMDTIVISDIFGVITPESLILFVSVLCSSLLILSLFLRKPGRRPVLMTAIATTGFSEIIFQLVIILAFQFIYGYVFYRVGMLVASFMGGSALGAWYMRKRKVTALSEELSFFKRIQLSVVIYPVILPFIFHYLSVSSGMPAAIGSDLIFPVLPAIAGIVGGMQFPSASNILLMSGSSLEDTSGSLYAFDLCGASAGALLAAGLLVPLLGINGVCYVAAMLNLSVLGAVILAFSD